MNFPLILLLKVVNGGQDELAGDVFISHWLFAVAARVEFTHNSHPQSVIPGTASGRLASMVPLWLVDSLPVSLISATSVYTEASQAQSTMLC